MENNPYQEAIEGLISKNTELLANLGPGYSSYRAYLESIIPVYDSLLQENSVPQEPIMKIIIGMNRGLQAALFEIDGRLKKLEDQ